LILLIVLILLAFVLENTISSWLYSIILFFDESLEYIESVGIVILNSFVIGKILFSSIDAIFFDTKIIEKIKVVVIIELMIIILE
jgi:hypothetical protein